MNIDYEQLEFIHPTLRQMVRSIEDATGFEFTITSLYRLNDDGVHGQLPLRGMDLRCRSGAIGVVIEEWFHRNWQYDPLRPNLNCCEMHGDGTNLHFHLQVHPNTVRY